MLEFVTLPRERKVAVERGDVMGSDKVFKIFPALLHGLQTIRTA